MKIVALPRNGIGNRLQMLASTYELARSLNAEATVLWSSQTVFQSPFADIFEQLPGMPLTNLDHLEGKLLASVPRFTHYDKELNRITMRNLRLGDQLFMPKLRKLLETSNSETEIWIDSGEKFTLNEGSRFEDSEEFREARRSFYSQIKFNGEIIKKYELLLQKTGSNYWAIHLRGTDRNFETMSNYQIMQRVRQTHLGLRAFGSTVFISSDDANRGRELSYLLIQEGYTVIFDENKNRDRLTSGEAQESVVDWLGLKNACAVVSFGGTTFSYEAVTAGNTYDSRVYLKPSEQKSAVNRLKREILFLRLYGKIPYMQKMI